MTSDPEIIPSDPPVQEEVPVFHQIGDQSVPHDPHANRAFRDAWALSNPHTIVIDMDKARNIQRDRIRLEREAAFAEADREWFLADEAEDKKQKDAIKAKKQKLRDAPAHPAIDAAQTPEELAALTLSALLA